MSDEARRRVTVRRAAERITQRYTEYGWMGPIMSSHVLTRVAEEEIAAVLAATERSDESGAAALEDSSEGALAKYGKHLPTCRLGCVVTRCDQCGGLLDLVRQESGYLNREQFDAVKAGDWYCKACRGTRGGTGYRYFWESELAKEPCDCGLAAALEAPHPRFVCARHVDAPFAQHPELSSFVLCPFCLREALEEHDAHDDAGGCMRQGLGAQRYFLASDNDGHWYVVEANKREEWNAWRALDPDDERSWSEPEFAMRLSGDPSLVTFEKFLLKEN